LEDRDWYRERPSDAWNERWRGPSAPPPSTSSGAGRIPSGTWLAIVVSVCVSVIGWRFDVLDRVVPSGATPAAATPQAPQADRVVRVGARPGLDVPVTVPTRWSISDRRFGRIAVLVPVGHTPRQALVVALADAGYQVVG
jgi:hypothetical protein